MVVGRIVNGLVRIGTAWIPRHPWGWSAELGNASETAEASF
jgi:hypothetical protein